MKKLILVILVILIFSAAYFFIWKEEPIDNEVPREETALLVETKDEAISRVEEMSVGLENFIDENKKYGPMLSTAKFYEDRGYWFISFWPEDSTDYWYIVHLGSDGNIIYEGIEGGG